LFDATRRGLCAFIRSMRRLSIILGLAALALAAVVGYTYSRRLDRGAARVVAPPPALPVDIDAAGNSGWVYHKSDPITHQPIVRAEARAYQRIKEPSTSRVEGLKLRLYNKLGTLYTFVECDKALFDEASGVMTTDGAVSIIMKVPVDTEPDDKQATARLTRIQGTAARYETKTGRATSDNLTKFQFADGNGQGVGVDYDPTTRELRVKSQVSLNWVGQNTPDKVMHVEAGELLYKEAEQKVLLSPWARMKRDTVTLESGNALVTLVDGHLHQVDSESGRGTELQDQRKIDFAADKLTSFFNDDGAMTSVVGEGHSRIVASDPTSHTTVTSNRGSLHFLVETKVVNGNQVNNSVLQNVEADGAALVESVPVVRPNVEQAETRILRSEHLRMDMQPGGQEIHEIRTDTAAQLEFKPNRPSQSHRVLDAARMVIDYGDDNSIDTVHAWKVTTHTDRPPKVTPAGAKPASTKNAKPPAPALTWSDELVAHFKPGTGQVAAIDQGGAFHYQEGDRQARSARAHLDQTENLITLTDAARVWDATGSTTADVIFMNQQSGDMDATGHVSATRQPDQSVSSGSSLLDDAKPMQARADKMLVRDSNLKISYEGHAVVWQGGNRTAANTIVIDRDEETFKATGSVVSELLDEKKSADNGPAEGKPEAGSKAPGSKTSPSTSGDTKPGDAKPGGGSAAAGGTGSAIFTVVRAPEMLYEDSTKLAHYTGGVKMTRDRMTVTSRELKAYFKENKDRQSGESSLDHAFADGAVVVNEIATDRTRNGTAEHVEYYTDDDRLVLNGGVPKFVDSLRGTTSGRQLIYYSDDDRLLVEGEKKALAVTHMKKK
jgi:lipopolysaccharide export system protein LptA